MNITLLLQHRSPADLGVSTVNLCHATDLEIIVFNKYETLKHSLFTRQKKPTIKSSKRLSIILSYARQISDLKNSYVYHPFRCCNLLRSSLLNPFPDGVLSLLVILCLILLLFQVRYGSIQHRYEVRHLICTFFKHGIP